MGKMPLPDEDPEARTDMRRRRRRVATIVLLLVEAVALIAALAVIGSFIDWDVEAGRDGPSQMVTNWIFMLSTSLPVAVLAILAGLMMALRLSPGWLLAMLAQGVLLFNSLLNYVGRRSEWVFPLMLLGIAYVLYLNSYAVRTALQPMPPVKPPSVRHDLGVDDGERGTG